MSDEVIERKQGTVKPPVTRAMRSWHWTCPDCDHRQFAEKSRTHVGECKRCGKLHTVAIINSVDDVSQLAATVAAAKAG